MRTFCVAATVVATIAMASEAMGEEAARQPPPKERVRLDLGAEDRGFMLRESKRLMSA